MNIFVTTGTQLPFDRIVEWANEWAGQNPTSIVTVQASEIKNEYRNIIKKGRIPPNEYKSLVEQSDILVGHAGIGTIITAHEFNLPLVMVPRKFTLGEHRNDHQKATAEKFCNSGGIYVADSKEEFFSLLSSEKLDSCPCSEIINRTLFVKNLKASIAKLI